MLRSVSQSDDLLSALKLLSCLTLSNITITEVIREEKIEKITGRMQAALNNMVEMMKNQIDKQSST